MRICQSCSMPLRENKDLGTNADASPSHDYCRFCYKGGQFTDEGITMAQKIDKMAGLARTMNIPEDKAREMANNILPTLKRWKNHNHSK
jgi:hypothetical protein